MPAVTTSTDLKTVLRLALPIGSRLVTGYPATPVNRVSHLRVRPPIFSDIAYREMVLLSTNALATTQTPLSLETIVEKLTQTEASALCVQGTLSPRTHQIAKAQNFPIISLPERAVLPQVERAIQRLLSDRQSQLEHRAIELQQTLQRHAASYRGLSTMLNALARMLDRPVVMHDRRGNVLGRGLPASHGQDWDAQLALLGGAEFVRRFDLEDRAAYEGDWRVIESPVGVTAPLIHEGQLLGYVSALTAGDRPDDFDLLSLEYSIPVLVREVARQQTIDVSLEPPRPARDWITDWITSPVTDDALLALRAGQDSFEAGMWYSVVVFQWVPTSDRSGGIFSPERLVRMLRAEMRQRRIQAPIGQYADRAVLLFPLDEPHQTQRLKQIVAHLHGALDESAPRWRRVGRRGPPGGGIDRAARFLPGS